MTNPVAWLASFVFCWLKPCAESCTGFFVRPLQDRLQARKARLERLRARDEMFAAAEENQRRYEAEQRAKETPTSWVQPHGDWYNADGRLNPRGRGSQKGW
jgi:hypothetical protein